MDASRSKKGKRLRKRRRRQGGVDPSSLALWGCLSLVVLVLGSAYVHVVVGLFDATSIGQSTSTTNSQGNVKSSPWAVLKGHFSHSQTQQTNKLQHSLLRRQAAANDKTQQQQLPQQPLHPDHEQHHANQPFHVPQPHQVATDSPRTKLSENVLQMCRQTVYHTLETTTILLPHNRTFVFTGDIDDLWLRDSAAQVHPYILFWNNNMTNNKILDRVVYGLIQQHAFYIRFDPYANAFRIDDKYKFSIDQMQLGRHGYISTYNYELDSGCYTIRMMYEYWKHSRYPEHLQSQPIIDSVRIMVQLWTAEQRHEDDAYPSGPLFLDCKQCGKPYRYKELTREGKGSPTNSSSGLSWTGFRPSDDPCRYHFLIPANMFLVVVLRYVEELCDGLWKTPDLKASSAALRVDVEEGIRQHGIVHHNEYGKMYAYEVDGLGNYTLMDDANVPSLLSLPYLGYDYDEEIYQNTRRFLLSTSNPYYFESSNHKIAGIGSPHMQARFRRNVWPMSIAIQALTTDNKEEAMALTEQLYELSAGTSWMHESVDVEDPHRFTRRWFCWADALFAELVLKILSDTNETHLCLTNQYKLFENRDPDSHFASEAVSS